MLWEACGLCSWIIKLYVCGLSLHFKVVSDAGWLLFFSSKHRFHYYYYYHINTIYYCLCYSTTVNISEPQKQCSHSAQWQGLWVTVVSIRFSHILHSNSSYQVPYILEGGWSEAPVRARQMVRNKPLLFLPGTFLTLDKWKRRNLPHVQGSDLSDTVSESKSACLYFSSKSAHDSAAPSFLWTSDKNRSYLADCSLHLPGSLPPDWRLFPGLLSISML